MYGLYHILLDKKVKEEMDSSRQNLKELHKLHLLNSPQPDEEVEVEEDLSKFLPSKPMKLEIEEGREDELSRYLGRRRGTIAVSHFKQDSGGANDIPEISICRSPSPTNDKNELQYKEKYLPRPTVLKVSSTFDRRASDGSATLQDSIAQFNLNWNHSKRRTLPKEASRNMLSVPENDTAGSESDTEHEAEVSNYLHGRGGRQRRTLPCFPTTPENEDPPSKIFRAVKPARASPTPYTPPGGVDPRLREFLPGSKKPLDLFGEHKQLQDQFNPNMRRNSSSNHVRENPYRHSYPFKEQPGPEDPSYHILRQKQEAEWADLDIQFAVRRKLLETKMQQEQAEFIRRASEGANNLENSIAAFHLKHPTAGSSPPTQAAPCASGDASLQDEMKKLNLMTPPHIADLPSFNVNPSFPTRSMDVDEEEAQQNANRFNRYPQAPPIFTAHSPSESVTNPFVPNFRTSNMRVPTFPGMDSPLLHDPFRRDSQEVVEHDSLNRTLSYDMIFAHSMNSIAQRVRLSLEEASVEYSQSGDNYFSLYKDGLQMEIEIFPEHKANKQMVKFRRVGGEVWTYKKLRERIVSALCVP